MAFFKKVTKLLAEDIYKQRQFAGKPASVRNDATLFNESMKKARSLKEIEYLKVTMKIFNNPLDIIVVLKNDGLKGLFKVLFAPIISFVVNHSLLSPKAKRNIGYKLNSIVSSVNLKEIQDVQVPEKVMIKA